MNDGYKICWSLEDFQTALNRASGSQFVGLDFETCPHLARENTTSALRAEDGARVAGYGIAWIEDGQYQSAYCPTRHMTQTAGGKNVNPKLAAEAVSAMIAGLRPDQGIVVANMMMELSFMLGERIVWPLRGQIHDVQVAARVLNKGIGIKELIGLKPLAAEYLSRQMETKSDLDEWLVKHRYKPGRDIWRAPAAIAGTYCQDDARDTLALWMLWKDDVYQLPTQWWWHRDPDRMNRRDLYELEIEAATKAVMTSLRGTRIDKALCKKMSEAAKILQEVTKRWVQDEFGMPNLNPGSGVQVRGLLFTEAFGLDVDAEHMTASFTELPDREQVKVLNGTGDKSAKDYASLDIDALKAYEKILPEKKDVFFMLAVYRKCQTALMWFEDNVVEYGQFLQDPWWADEGQWMWAIFHRLRTIGTISGRMASKDYNSQNVPKRFKMLIDAERLIEILTRYLPESQISELVQLLCIAHAEDGDEAKSVGVSGGAKVVDFSVRRMMIARPGCRFRTHDLSQVEMKGFAHFSGNKLLRDGYGPPLSEDTINSELAAFRSVIDGADPAVAFAHLKVDRHERMELDNKFDIHQFVSDEIEIARKAAKGINFGIVYGMGQSKLGRSLGWAPDKCKLYLARYHAKFPEIASVQSAIKDKLRQRGYVFDPFGRRYYLHVSRAYVGLNRLIQGWAASMFKVGFVRVCDLFASPYYGGIYDKVMRRPSMEGAKVLACVHDELDSEIPADKDDQLLDFAVRSCMTITGGLTIPLSTSSESSESSWDDAKTVRFIQGDSSGINRS